MIFNSNTTSLGSSIAMAEGYDGTIGVARALIESAQSDRAMFMAMLESDARELNAVKSGYVNEAEITAINEAAVSGIWNKIKELFTKLIAKIKSIAHNFMAKFRSLYMSDKKLVKQYRDEVLRKTHIDNLEVKWRKKKTSAPTISQAVKTSEFSADEITKLKSKWDDSTDKIWKNVTGTSEDASELREKLNDDIWEDDTPDTYKIKEIGGIRKIVEYLEGAEKEEKDFDSDVKKTNKVFEKLVKEADKAASDATKKDSGKTETEAKEAQQSYEVALVMQQESLTKISVAVDAMKVWHAQNKAAFMKAVAANDKKLEENAIYLDAIAEAAEQEVEDVISGAFKSEELSKINSASLNVKDGDVSDDPDKLTYGPDSYTDEYKKTPVDGSIDADPVGKCESSIFSSLIY